eukprot:TRINITY_DN6263_c0_g3_i3.p1 TRINITY_DN6263_c0_g3~~TRINITY_DN6263_c0_g3_i3.p1  ORF type:complete len:160 (-),score=44.46 TRINITY_DN6263_c0_g3_i3:471-950(-)
MLFKKIVDILMKTEFYICLNPIVANNVRVWEKMEALCEKLVNNQATKDGLVHIWQVAVVKCTIDLNTALIGINEEQFEVFKDFQVLPFEGLPMRKEYMLQVLFNAFANKHDPKYAKVVKSYLYADFFENWFKLLQLVKISLTLENSKILNFYTQGKAGD